MNSGSVTMTSSEISAIDAKASTDHATIGFPASFDELLGPPEALPVPRRHDYRPPDHARAFGRAKIMRPAFVCRALVTATSTVSPIRRRPFSITIIVPSSRYPTP